MIQTTLIILTRNELPGLKQCIQAIPVKAVDECFAIDYRSNDGTVEFFHNHGIRVIAQKKPGRGEAFRLAARRARGTYLIFFSPDGNEDPRDIPKLITLLKKGNDIAIASRFLPGSRNEEDGQLFKFRAWANRWFSWMVRLVWGSSIHDTINGYRGVTKRLFSELNLDAEGYAIEYQMTIRAIKLGKKIAEIPTREGDRVSGTTGAQSIPTGLIFLYYFLREIWIGKRFLQSP